VFDFSIPSALELKVYIVALATVMVAGPIGAFVGVGPSRFGALLSGFGRGRLIVIAIAALVVISLPAYVAPKLAALIGGVGLIVGLMARSHL